MLVSRKLLMGGASPSVEIYGVQSTHAFAGHNTSSVTASNASLGTAHSDREVWVVVTSMDEPSDGDQGVSTGVVTIGENSASKMFEHVPGSYVNNIGISYWKYTDDGTLGSNSDIVVNFPNVLIHTGLIVFTANKTSALLDYYADDDSAASPTTGSINTSVNGWSFYCAMCQNSSSATIAGFGNDGSFDAGTGEWVTYGYNSPEDNGTVSVGLPSSTGTMAVTISGISVESE